MSEAAYGSASPDIAALVRATLAFQPRHLASDPKGHHTPLKYNSIPLITSRSRTKSTRSLLRAIGAPSDFIAHLKLNDLSSISENSRMHFADQRLFTHDQRMAIYRRDKGVCQLHIKCDGMKCDWDSWEADHIRPRAKGGRTTVINGQVACLACNPSKGDTHVAAWVAEADFERLTGKAVSRSRGPRAEEAKRRSKNRPSRKDEDLFIS
ncbi:MAG: hypothetical protein QOJ84_1462 [Bradyrhizobium sp.]|nr:hypothetical protein [Bradyrhizobium sp.]